MKNLTFYVGKTGDLKRRLFEHNSRSGGKYTKRNAPYKLIYYEAYVNKKDAEEAERFYKSGYGREIFKKKIANYLFTRE